MIKLLKPVLSGGVSVTVVTRPPEDFKPNERESVSGTLKHLEEARISVHLKSEFHQKFAVIDHQTVWYGSVNLLSFGGHEESMMRFENPDIAGALTDTISNG